MKLIGSKRLERATVGSQGHRDHAVCIVGLGYVGLTLAVAMADVGFNVLGVEIRDDVLDLLGRGKPHFEEPGLEEKLQRNLARGTLRCAKHIPDGWGGSVYIITVGTPLDANGKVRLDMITAVASEVSGHLREGDLVILRSTVRVRTTNGVVAPILDRAGVRYDIAFCPERTLEGKALTELRQLPQIVGARDAIAAVRASQLFQFLTPTVVRVSDAETAETIKLVDNAQRDMLFGYANEVARMCDAFGVSATEVIRAGKLGYPRTNLPMPGLVGGPCLEKDPYILEEGLHGTGIEPEMTKAARLINERQPREAVAYLKSLYDAAPGRDEKPVIVLLGLAFKGQPPTDDLRGTMAKHVFAALREAFPGAQFRGYDAVVPASAIQAFGVEPQCSLEEAFEGASIAVILNNHPVFPAMPLSVLSERMRKPAFVYDFWASFDASELHLAAGAGYVALGSHARAILPTSMADTWPSTSSSLAAAAS